MYIFWLPNNKENERKEDEGILSIFNFGKSNKNKPRAAVFIDFEHWYIALDNYFKIKPDIKMLSDSLNEKYDVCDFIFFGDFSNPSLANEMQKIRGFTNQIVETNNGSGRVKKDYTDFIMLDHIYRSAYQEKDIDTYIIFTGDGHFSSAVLFLKNSCKKEVIVYGVKNAFSGQLKQAASAFVELPSEKQLLPMAVTPILESLYLLYKENENTRFTFSKTVPAVAEKYGMAEDEVKIALEKLIEKGYVSQYETNIKGRKVRLLNIDFKKAQNDGLLSK